MLFLFLLLLSLVLPILEGGVFVPSEKLGGWKNSFLGEKKLPTRMAAALSSEVLLSFVFPKEELTKLELAKKGLGKFGGLGLIELMLGLIELRLGLIELMLGLIELVLGLIELVLGLKELVSCQKLEMIEFGVRIPEGERLVP